MPWAPGVRKVSRSSSQCTRRIKDFQAVSIIRVTCRRLTGDLDFRHKFTLLKLINYFHGAKVNEFAVRLDYHIRSQRLLVWIVDPRETLYLARQGFFVESLDVPLCQHIDGTRHENLEKLGAILFDQSSHLITRLAVRRDGRRYRRYAVPRK